MESGGEVATFQEQPITGNGSSQESAVGCVTDGKKEFCSLRKYHNSVQNPFPFSKVLVLCKFRRRNAWKSSRGQIAWVPLSKLSRNSVYFLVEVVFH